MQRTVDVSGITSFAEYCTYPMWTIPGTGDGRCDWNIGCPMVPEDKCNDVEVIEKGDTCLVACLNNPNWTETWVCVGGETWERQGDEMDCLRDPDDVVTNPPGESGSLALALSTVATGLIALSLY